MHWQKIPLYHAKANLHSPVSGIKPITNINISPSFREENNHESEPLGVLAPLFPDRGCILS